MEFENPLVEVIMEQCPPVYVQRSIKKLGRMSEAYINKNDRIFRVTPLIALATIPREDDRDAIQIAKLLVDNGADINARDSGPGSTALFMAAQTGKPKLLKWLMDNGAQIDITARTSRTPAVAMSAHNGEIECVALLANAARVEDKLHILDVPNQLQGRTPAWVAIARGHTEIVGILCKAGVDLRKACPSKYEVILHGGERSLDLPIDQRKCPIQHALNNAAFSFSHMSCAQCSKKVGDGISSCGRCQMAMYCSRECQSKHYKSTHKYVCKGLKKGMDMYGSPDDKLNPPKESYGFEEEFGGEDFETGPDLGLKGDFVWEYDAGQPGVEDWRRFPPAVESKIEFALDMGDEKYSYRPSFREYEGTSQREITPDMPDNVSTCFIWFSDMIEREIYTGAGRSVRRNGTSKPHVKRRANGEW